MHAAARASLNAAAALAALSGVAHAREQSILNFEVEGGANAVAFAWREGADILVEPELFATLGLKRPEGDAPAISLRALSGLGYSINEATATVHIVCAASCYPSHVLSEHQSAGAVAPALTGLVLNYDLSASQIDGAWRVGGLFDGVLLADQWRIEGAALAQSEGEVTRLDAAWVMDRPARRTRLRVGDSVSRGGGLGVPVRYGGVKFGTDFSLDPAFISFPTPQLSGAAALPSVLDIYVNDTLRQSRAAPAGPFTIADPPIAAGANTASLVITDALGRQQISTQAFYVAPRLLRDGLADYTADLGWQRRNYAVESDDYADPFAALSVRRGFGGVTGEARAEAQTGAQAVGLDVAGAAALLGEGEAGAVLSQSERGGGALALLGWTRAARRWSVSARVEAAGRDFVRLGELQSGADRLRASTSFSWNDSWDGGYAISYLQAKPWSGRESRSWSATYSKPLTSRVSVQAASLIVEAPRASATFSISLSTTLGLRRSASAQVESGARGTRGDFRAQQTANPTGGVGWRVATSQGVVERYDAGASALTSVGEGEIEFSRAGASTGARAGFRGGLAWLDGAMHAARPLRDAFALVEAPRGMDVMLDNRRVARVGEKGRVLVADLRANDVNRLSIDVDQAPADAQIGASEIVARPGSRGGALARFAISEQRGRWIDVRAPDGAPAPLGILLTRTDGAQFFTGTGGRAYVARTEDAHVLTASFDNRPCSLDLARQEERLICAPQ